MLFPAVFGILKNKNLETYQEFFKTLKELVGPLSPELIKTNYEQASIRALQESFPGVRISGCLFHLGQAIDRKIKDLNLANTLGYPNIRYFELSVLTNIKI